jgi:hypothetical protein
VTTKTRYFVIASLLTLTVGLGAGLVAYSVGFSTSAYTRQGGPDELQFIPANAGVVAFADVHDIMTSDLRQRLRFLLPHRDGQQEFQTRTGINIETDIDHVLVGVMPGAEGSGSHGGAAVVLARGRFDQVKIEQLMREHGAQVEDYKGTRLINGESRDRNVSVSVAFLQPGLIAVGSTALVRGAVDLKAGGSSVSTNDALMALIRDLDSGNAWAVGRFDALTSQASFPTNVTDQIPAVTYFSASAHIDSGIRGTIRADTRDEAAANSLRDVVRGFVALAQLQSGSRPDIATALHSLQLGGTGKTVSLSFDLPATAIESLGALKPPATAPGTPR